MKTPFELSQEELADIVEDVQLILWFETGEWNREKELGEKDLVKLAQILERAGLKPGVGDA